MILNSQIFNRHLTNTRAFVCVLFPVLYCNGRSVRINEDHVEYHKYLMPVSSSETFHNLFASSILYDAPSELILTGNPFLPFLPPGPKNSPPFTSGSTAARTDGKAPMLGFWVTKYMIGKNMYLMLLKNLHLPRSV